MASFRYVFNDIPYLPRRAQSGAHAALKRCAERSVEVARLHCPVDTGALRDSIFARVGPFPSRTVRFGATAPHASYVEFGTHKMAARPFLGRAIAEVRPEYRSICQSAMAAALHGRGRAAA